MEPLPPVDLHLRSYGGGREGDRHAYAQLVLPVSGTVMLDIEGRQGRLDPVHGAVVAAGAWHAQWSAVANRSIIVDIDGAVLEQGPWQGLLERPFAPLGAAARKLVEFMGIMAARPGHAPSLVQGWMPLLLDTLALDAPQPASRLAALLARMEAEPGLPWTTEAMARAAHLSVSRLHALFREALDTSPHDWLLQCRIRRVCEWLAGTERTVAEIALAAGFSDQSALTRALRRTMDCTPAAYRRASRETRPKNQ
ncbi:helix-turn-helix transcriptional regulator [Massilia niastensis]|uniref:helix-turn-helix transcriptional regulator n=1 Tax=Massilia niastensis TaxID=544911 RepID=UPI00037F8EE6|nr:AraC family transcriptional regulator [Massilia niastensis]